MPKKKLNKSTRKKYRIVQQKIIRALFAILVLYMAGQTLINGYAASKLEDEQQISTEQTAFIDMIVPVSQKMQELYGVRASVSIAQAILESDWGSSELAAEYHNLFGVKGSAEGSSVLMETQEFVDGEWITISAYFKAYENYAASIEDHADLMVNGTDWNPSLYHPVLQATTYEEAAHALQKAGYATDPTYPQKLIDLIERYELYKYDLPTQVDE